ncbi:TetR/AcrR family transcriptional regulator [Chitinophaga vietnamensis]|uniref:TetR/AcrR family transcriptional regulator n=1 Tax=Chitinophaga vietnamensis TaxID=2593957 RepID=UPI0011780FE4|nr:TetR/AcrR family transcriptional regulator [Chitinophaga vietnamensis]
MAEEKSTEAQIKAAAQKIFLQKGLAGARMQDIADEAGINKAMLHYYYRSKDKLFEIIFEEAMDNMLKSLHSILQSRGSFKEMVAGIVDNYITQLSARPYLPVFILNEINQNPERMIRRFRNASHPPDIEAFAERVKQAQKKGEIRKISPLQLLMNVISMCVFPFAAKPLIQALAGLDEVQYRMAMEERRKQLTEFILAAVKP